MFIDKQTWSTDEKNEFFKGRECTKKSFSPTIFVWHRNTILREIGADNTEPVICKTTQAKSPKMSLLALPVMVVLNK